jgi:hypothetical protein
MAGISSRLRSRVKPGRVSLVPLKTTRAGNFCPQTFWQLSHYARQALRRMRTRTTLVTGFWAQAELF